VRVWARGESVRLSKSPDHRAPLFTTQVHRDRSPSRSPKRRAFIGFPVAFPGDAAESAWCPPGARPLR